MLEIEPLSPRIGARITNLDLAQPLSEQEFRALEEVWNERHLLVFPDQRALPLEAQTALLAHFGPIIEERIPGEKHSYVSNADGLGTDEMNAGYREGELTAHMDYTYTPYPADVISLYCTELPEGGSETRFYDNVTPLSKMPRDLRERLSQYHVLCAHDLSTMKPDAKLYLEERTNPEAPTQSHVWPMIRPHPSKPGVEALVCTLQQTERVLELSDEANDDAESRALLGRIFDEFLYVPENEYVHAWQVGELVVWDNAALQHARSACPRTRGARSFRRVAVCEAGNAIQETVQFLSLSDSSVAFS